MSRPQIDQIDREIIGHLSKDARITNRAVAEILGVTEGTIRARLKRLMEARLIRFTALTNMSRLGAMRVLFIRIKAELRKVRQVADQIARMDEIKCAIVITGPHNILAMGPFDDFDNGGVEAVTTRIGALDGVVSWETSITLEAVKYNVLTAKILNRQPAEDEESDD